MTLNACIHFDGPHLHINALPADHIAHAVGTPLYVYSLRRVLLNYRRIQAAFSQCNADIHYSAKANANLAILQTLTYAGAGVDVVSAGEIFRALRAGASAQRLVFAGVGKTPDEIRYAIAEGVGWLNIENVDECRIINDTAAALGRDRVRVALRLNPEVTANTHPYIATGHGAAKFGLTADAVAYLLAHRHDFPHLDIAGIHIHIGSQLHDINPTRQAIQRARHLIADHPHIHTINIGGGLPVAYGDDALPDLTAFADALAPLLQGYHVILEPGRAIVADAGVLLMQVLYTKHQAGQMIVITDASMTELLRPALYGAHHQIVPAQRRDGPAQVMQIAGPVCETADMLARDVPLPPLQVGDTLAALTAGAYGMVMASNYNARPRPAEVVIETNGADWRVARQRETWADLIQHES